MVEEDEAHQRARTAFAGLAAEEAVLVTSSYALLECYALLGRRFGMDAMRRFRRDFVPLLKTVWVDAELHEHALDDLLARRSHELSLVDVVSLALTRTQKLDGAFAFGRHFEAEGILLVGPWRSPVWFSCRNCISLLSARYYRGSKTGIEATMKSLSLKLPAELEVKLAEIARQHNVSKSSLVREAIAEYVVEPSRPAGESFLVQARDLAGCVDAAEDLSTNPVHLRGLGE